MARKVLFFTQSLLFGGDDTVLLELISQWPRSDQLAVALNSGHPGRALYAERLKGRAEVLVLDEKTVVEERPPLWARPFAFLGSFKRLKRFIGREKPDVLFLSSGGYPLSELSWRMLCAARLKGVAKVLLLIHNYPAPKKGALRRVAARIFGVLTPRLCHEVVTVSQDCAAALARFMQTPTPRCVYNGIAFSNGSADRSRKLRQLGLSGGPILGAMGHFEERKGLRYLVMAMPRILEEFPEAQAVLIGGASEPAYFDEIRGLVRDLGLEGRVLLPGFLPDAGQYAECFDVCVIPSVTRESFGMAALEAMRYKKPVVATSVGGLPEVVLDGGTGYLAPPRDARALAEAVLKLLKSPQSAREMGERGFARLCEHFTSERMAKEYCRLAQI